MALHLIHQGHNLSGLLQNIRLKAGSFSLTHFQEGGNGLISHLADGLPHRVLVLGGLVDGKDIRVLGKER